MADLSHVKQSHPLLYQSVVAQFNRYAAWVKEDKALREWTSNFDGMAILDEMSDALLLSPEVQALGDQRCTGMFPLMEDVSTLQVQAASGEKIKLIGPYSPTVFAVLENALVQASPQDDGTAQILIWGRADVLAATPLRMKKLWVTIPGVQYVVRDSNGIRVVAAHTCDMIQEAKWSVILNSLTTWQSVSNLSEGESWDGPGIPGLSRFEVLGRGGFSVVYRAWQEGLDRPVAVKVLLADLSDEDDARRFRRECTVLGRLGQHRHIVDVFDAGVTRDLRPYIVMKYYSRGTLAQRLRDSGPIPAGEAVEVLADLAAAVQAGHDQGVVHRDIKPDNVLMDEDGSVVLADFGVAAWVDEDHTRTGSGAFSQAYAAPEVLEDNQYGTASDVYSLAATGYAMLTGRAPFHSTSGSRQILAIVSKPPEPITTAGVPGALAKVLLAAMAKDPAERPSTAAELADQLRAAVAAEPAAEPRLTLCVECGTAIEGQRKFCPQCGHRQDADKVEATTLRPAAPSTKPAAPPQNRQPRTPKTASRKYPIAPLVAGLLVLVLAGGAALYLLAMRPGTQSAAQASDSQAAGTSKTTAPVAPTPAKPSRTTAAPRPAATVTVVATPTEGDDVSGGSRALLVDTPQAAENLSESEAVDQLDQRRVTDGLPALEGMRGHWVPQVSSKCKGLTVDIQPGYFPDGREETQSVTSGEILAFHIALADDFGAVTLDETDFAHETTSICANRTKWVALVPNTFNGRAAATQWCIDEGFPWGECAARPIPSTPGGPSKLYLPSQSDWYAMGGL